MPSISRRGDTFRIMVSLGYGMDGRKAGYGLRIRV